MTSTCESVGPCTRPTPEQGSGVWYQMFYDNKTVWWNQEMKDTNSGYQRKTWMMNPQCMCGTEKKQVVKRVRITTDRTTARDSLEHRRQSLKAPPRQEAKPVLLKFQIKLNIFLDTLIQETFFKIMKINYFRVTSPTFRIEKNHWARRLSPQVSY